MDGNKQNNLLAGISYIDLFSGIGAFRLAMNSFGAKCVFSSEIDEDCQLVYEKNYGERPAGDITTIKTSDIPPFDVLCAGFPCQPFALAGKQLGFHDPRGRLFFEIIRIAEAHRPPLMILENVPNLINHDEGNTFRSMKCRLVNAGYSVDHELLNASDFGVPQARRRVYIVCTLRGMIDEFRFPAPMKKDIALSDILLPREQTSKWIVHLKQRPHSLDRRPVPRCLRPVRIGKINGGSMGERIYHPNGHAITFCKSGGGCGGKTGMYLIDDVVRKLDPRECARASGFPETFQLHENSVIAQGQFGNSIVVDVLQHIIKVLIVQDVFQKLPGRVLGCQSLLNAKYPCATFAKPGNAGTDSGDLYDRFTKEDCDQHRLRRPFLQGQVKDDDMRKKSNMWTTPTAHDYNASGKYAQGGTPLSFQAKTWLSPIESIAPNVGNVEAASPDGDTKFPHHPIAELFPRLAEKEMAELAEDIAANGQREPGVVWNGKLLDGLSREHACKLKDVPFKVVTRDFASESDAVAFVVSANIRRRHLDESQRAMIGAKLMEFLSAAKTTDSKAKNENGGSNVGTLKSRDKAAAALNVSPRSIQNAVKVLADGVPELADAVSSGQVSASAAAQVASLPKDQQVKIVNTPGGVKAEATRLRNDKKMATKDDEKKFLEPTVPSRTDRSPADPLKNTGTPEENNMPAVPEPKTSPADLAVVNNRLRYAPNDAEIDRAARIFCDVNAVHADCNGLAARLLDGKHLCEAVATWSTVEEFASKMRQAFESMSKENPSNG